MKHMIRVQPLDEHSYQVQVVGLDSVDSFLVPSANFFDYETATQYARKIKHDYYPTASIKARQYRGKVVQM